jgi:anti-sigma factor (TIGR02949 family)
MSGALRSRNATDSSCRLVQRHVGAYVDGELDPGSMLDFERHIEACAACQERVEFERSYRDLVDSSLGATAAPAHLSDRVRITLDRLDAMQRERAGGADARAAGSRLANVPWKQVVPLAAAAVVLLAIGGVVGGVPDGLVQEASATPIFEDVVRLHSAGLPADVQAQAPQQVTRYFRGKVAFPVRPAVFDRGDVHLLGGRLSNVRERRAAAVYYDVHGSRVTLVVFEAPELSHDAFRMRFRGQELYYRDVNGYPVPVRQYHGLNYAFTGDLSRAQMMQLAASARVVP